jgi:radical SAM superfamily enzyme YgiQ (UPF0313 family)
MNVLLLSPNTLTNPYPVYPLGLDYVAGAIPAHHRVKIVDLLHTSIDELGMLLQSFKPAIIGISCRNIDSVDYSDSIGFVDEYRRLIVMLRQLCPQATIVCGGSGFTIMPQRILAELDGDFGVVGEGERFGLLLDALENGRDPRMIPGVITKPQSGPPPPPWTGAMQRLMPENGAHMHYYLAHGGMLNLQSKRGCPFRCIYCSYPGIEGKKHRLLDPEQVAKTARGLERAGARYLFFTDSAFNSDIEHSLAVANAMKASGLTIPWGAFFAPIRLPEAYFPTMAEAGCKHVEFGSESLSDTMLKAYRKPYASNEVVSAHRQARRAGLHIAHYFLLGGPGETAATIEESLARIERLERAVFFFFTGIRIYPGTALYDLALAEGKITAESDLLRPLYYRPDGIALENIGPMVRKQAAGRVNWIIGGGDQNSARTIAKLYERGFTGPLWEYLQR